MPTRPNALHFTKKHKPKLQNLELYGQGTGFTKRAVYLGVTLHHRLNWKSHCDTVRARALSSLRELTPLLRSSLPVRTKLLLYQAYIRPQIIYAAEAWAFISKSNLTRLQAIQNRAIRLIGDYDWDYTNAQIHEDNNMPTLHTYIKHQTQNFYKKFKHHKNRIITQLGQSGPNNTRILTPQAILS